MDDKDLFPQDNGVISQLLQEIASLNQTLGEQRSLLTELNRNIGSLQATFKDFPEVMQSFAEGFSQYQRYSGDSGKEFPGDFVSASEL